MGDQSVFIKASIESIQTHLIEGSILAAIVVFIFLWSFRSTLIAATAIPTSLIATFGLMAALGFTLNSITMLALTLMVGIVIDDAIVVLENIFRYVEEKGMHPFQAAIEGTREIGLAVMATTLVTPGGFPAGWIHGRDRRPLHVVVWFDFVVRNRCFAPRFIHPNAHAGGAVDQAPVTARKKVPMRDGLSLPITVRNNQGFTVRLIASTRGC